MERCYNRYAAIVPYSGRSTGWSRRWRESRSRQRPGSWPCLPSQPS